MCQRAADSRKEALSSELETWKEVNWPYFLLTVNNTNEIVKAKSQLVSICVTPASSTAELGLKPTPAHVPKSLLLYLFPDPTSTEPEESLWVPYSPSFHT